MTLKKILAARQEAIAARWVEMAHGTYPFGTIGFLRTRQDRFVNPVGHRTKEVIAVIMRVLLAAEAEVESMRPALDEGLEEFIKVRAIQDFSPEEAVGVICGLKNIIRQELASDLAKHNLYKDLLELELHIDAVEIMAFGIYTRCREKIYDMKAEESRRRNALLLRRAERVLERAGEPEANLTE